MKVDILTVFFYLVLENTSSLIIFGDEIIVFLRRMILNYGKYVIKRMALIDKIKMLNDSRIIIILMLYCILPKMPNVFDLEKSFDGS